jgi:XTP/dITP diphosphohydrolase
VGKIAPVTTLLIATRNLHKVEEIRAILGGRFRYLTLQSFADAPEVLEDAPTFSGNATKKALQLAKWLAGNLQLNDKSVEERLFVLADDSGLEVDALEGAPGVHSARFAALDTGAPGNSPTAENNAKLLRLLQNVPLEKRSGRFQCVVALTPVPQAVAESTSPVCYADECELSTQLFDGVCEGHIVLEPRGRGGFGYDPLFVPLGYNQTFGELPESVKNQLSHRAKALEKVKKRLGNL